MKAKPTLEQLEQIKLLRAQMVIFVQEIHKANGVIPNGHLYAVCMPHMDFQRYTLIVTEFKQQGWLRESYNLFRWVGPEVTMVEESAARQNAKDDLEMATTEAQE